MGEAVLSYPRAREIRTTHALEHKISPPLAAIVIGAALVGSPVATTRKEDLEMAVTSNYALRLPASLKKAVEDLARKDGTTLNQFIVSAVAEKLAALGTADYFAERAARGEIDAALRILARPGGEPPRPGDEIPADYRRDG